MAKVLKSFITKMLKSLLTEWLEDFLILIGVVIVLYNTYQHFGNVIGNYVLGAIFLLFGFAFAKW
ncbi:hypothetical protein SAMN05192569_10552 [Parageobacillus thermantarcticus]|uniref:Uncharacterized protein n=1 Tax=Parageobacillus thermantarcticus TaxID=186116 RepID=A0A1I0TSE5_9BACL|nr:hypothetical protein SAMN05192569_10552 [Parageobacillus thermantarcticus]